MEEAGQVGTRNGSIQRIHIQLNQILDASCFGQPLQIIELNQRSELIQIKHFFISTPITLLLANMLINQLLKTLAIIVSIQKILFCLGTIL